MVNRAEDLGQPLRKSGFLSFDPFMTRPGWRHQAPEALRTAFDLYQHITDTIIASIEVVVPECRKPRSGNIGSAAFCHRVKLRLFISRQTISRAIAWHLCGYQAHF